MISKIIDNIKTLSIALVIALIIRSLFFQPFYIPSSSMEPTLLVGDRIFVSKYTYGFSKHSFPFSPPIFKNRIFFSMPEYGDLVVFKTPADNRTDYIKRLIGLPGDEIQIVKGELFINKKQINREKIIIESNIRCSGNNHVINGFKVLLNNKEYIAVYSKIGSMIILMFIVPEKHYFSLAITEIVLVIVDFYHMLDMFMKTIL